MKTKMGRFREEHTDGVRDGEKEREKGRLTRENQRRLGDRESC